MNITGSFCWKPSEKGKTEEEKNQNFSKIWWYF